MKSIREGFPGQRLVRLPEEALRRSRRLALVRDLYVTDIGHFPESRHHVVDRPEGCPNHILIYCVAGSGWLQRGGRRRVTVRPDQVAILPAGVPHRYGADADTPWKIYWVHFNGKRSGDYLQLLRPERGESLLFVPDAEFIVAAFEETYRRMDAGLTDAGLLLMSTGLGRMLALTNQYRRAAGRKSRLAEDRIARSLQWMQEQVGEPGRLADLARRAGLSVPHYCALFKRQAGTSPMQYLARLRLQRACALLGHTTRPIGEIAQQVGYESPFHFSRSFHRFVGASPRAYRAAVREA